MFDERPKNGPTNFFFKELPQPRLREKIASDLSLERAREYVEFSKRFYSHEIPLLSREDFFYEEVENTYVRRALGVEEGSIDQHFAQVMDTFRRTLNDNTRLLFLVYGPALMMLLSFGIVALLMGPGKVPGGSLVGAALSGLGGGPIVTIVIAVALAVFALWLIYKIPYEVIQQRNVFGLNIYLANKFGRINHNFQVAKQKALNTEREKLLSQVNELKEEAAAWTLTYQWMALRLMLCDTLIRNTLFQIRRNTVLYSLGGAFGCLALGFVIVIVAIMLGEGRLFEDGEGRVFALLTLGGGISAYAIFSYMIAMRLPFRIVSMALEANQWTRFHMLNLPQTVADHVGQDKAQIVTFRDRNRVEVA